MRPIYYIRWLDACYTEGECSVAAIDPRCELEYVGPLAKESPEAVTLALEVVHDGRTRNPFSIRRENILQIRKTTIERAFGLKRS